MTTDIFLALVLCWQQAVGRASLGRCYFHVNSRNGKETFYIKYIWTQCWVIFLWFRKHSHRALHPRLMNKLWPDCVVRAMWHARVSGRFRPPEARPSSETQHSGFFFFSLYITVMCNRILNVSVKIFLNDTNWLKTEKTPSHSPWETLSIVLFRREIPLKSDIV